MCQDSKASFSTKRKGVRPRGMIFAVYFQVTFFCIYWSLYYKSWYRSQTLAITSNQKQLRGSNQVVTLYMNDPETTVSNIFVGISHSDKSVSDAAIHFLLEAACVHSMESYILLDKRDSHSLLGRKISLFGQQKYTSWSSGNLVRPTCTDLIHITLAPSQQELIRQSKARLVNDGVTLSSLQSRQQIIPDNPLDPQNRIASIKRAREYQRQMIRALFREKKYDLEQSVIAVLDLDMFAYPPLDQVIETSVRYIRHSSEPQHDTAKFHAICANGLQGGGSRSHPNPEYYDTFATILLPDKWLYLKRTSMSQDEILNWFFDKGTTRHDDTASHHPVPVRSCFGGFALYQANIWLESTCRYDSYKKVPTEFIGSKEHHTCEHVVFHECLREQLDGGGYGFTIALQPNLLTLWHLV